ncbi:hypothetical protein A9R05_38995 (plasmid) [Burkholderia sp. KK1]|nr:hypothetical protein A9R05_38995 [Burkholderia sp. KK1]
MPIGHNDVGKLSAECRQPLEAMTASADLMAGMFQCEPEARKVDIVIVEQKNSCHDSRPVVQGGAIFMPN